MLLLVEDSAGHEVSRSAEMRVPVAIPCASRRGARDCSVRRAARLIGLLAGVGHSAAFFCNAMQAGTLYALQDSAGRRDGAVGDRPRHRPARRDADRGRSTARVSRCATDGARRRRGDRARRIDRFTRLVIRAVRRARSDARAPGRGGCRGCRRHCARGALGAGSRAAARRRRRRLARDAATPARARAVHQAAGGDGRRHRRARPGRASGLGPDRRAAHDARRRGASRRCPCRCPCSRPMRRATITRRLFAEAGERLAAAVAWLHDNGYAHVAIVSHSLGAAMVERVARPARRARVDAWVPVGMFVAFASRPREPVLDVVAERDFPEVLAARQGARPRSCPATAARRAVSIAGADHYFGDAAQRARRGDRRRSSSARSTASAEPPSRDLALGLARRPGSVNRP